MNDENARLAAEIAALPAWVKGIQGLDIDSGIEHCETAEDYLDALAVFAASISKKSGEISEFLETANWQMYTLRVHSLKSTARLIGATELSELAAELEAAGKDGDTETIRTKTPTLLRDYEAFLPILEYEPSTDTKAAETVAQPDISDATLADAYAAIEDFISCYDMESIQMVLDSLSEYKLSPADQEKAAAIQKSLNASDWENLRGIML